MFNIYWAFATDKPLISILQEFSQSLQMFYEFIIILIILL